jgi:hypothetical protein
MSSGNINKKAGVTVGNAHYRMMQGDKNLAILRRKDKGVYEYFGEAGLQKEIDPLTIEGKRDVLRRRVLEILAEAEERTET